MGFGEGRPLPSCQGTPAPSPPQAPRPPHPRPAAPAQPPCRSGSASSSPPPCKQGPGALRPSPLATSSQRQARPRLALRDICPTLPLPPCHTFLGQCPSPQASQGHLASLGSYRVAGFPQPGFPLPPSPSWTSSSLTRPDPGSPKCVQRGSGRGSLLVSPSVFQICLRALSRAPDPPPGNPSQCLLNESPPSVPPTPALIQGTRSSQAQSLMRSVGIYHLLHSSGKHLLSTYCVLGTVVHAKDTAGNKRGRSHPGRADLLGGGGGKQVDQCIMECARSVGIGNK